jgi:hypothetical protein
MEEAMGRLRYSEEIVSDLINASRGSAPGAQAGRKKPSVWREAREARDEWRRNRYARLLENGTERVAVRRAPATRIA